MRWESANEITAKVAFQMGDPAILTTLAGSQVPVQIIIERDSAKVIPNEGRDGFYEVLDNAIGQFRTKIDIALATGAPITLKTQIVGCTVKYGEESYIVEYVLMRDTYVIKTLCRRG
jgi:hypothetical protein